MNKTRACDIAECLGFCAVAMRHVRHQFCERRTSIRRLICLGARLCWPQRKARQQQLVAVQPNASLAGLRSRLDRPFRTPPFDVRLCKLGFEPQHVGSHEEHGQIFMNILFGSIPSSLPEAGFCG
jgi:hypothetical protein